MLGVGEIVLVSFRLKNAIQNYKEFLSLAASPITSILMAEDVEKKWKQLKQTVNRFSQVYQVMQKLSCVI